MNTELQTTAPRLPVAQRAALALGVSEDKKAELRELAARTVSIVTITNQDGYQQVHSGRMALRNERVSLEKLGKSAREDATAFSKAVIDEEKRLIAIISPEEQRLQKIQDAYDEAEEKAKQALIDAELQRVEAIKQRVVELSGAIGMAKRFNLTAAQFAEHISDLESIPVDESFEEFREQAEAAKADTLATLREMQSAADAREKQAAQNEIDRLAIAAERAQDAERQAAERNRIAEDERVAKAARDAEAAVQAEKFRIEREAFEAEKSAQAEADRKVKEAQEAEQARLAAQREALEAKQAEDRRVEEAAEAARVEAVEVEKRRQVAAALLAKRSKFPGEQAIVSALMKHFEVPEMVVSSWLGQLQKQAA